MQPEPEVGPDGLGVPTVTTGAVVGGSGGSIPSQSMGMSLGLPVVTISGGGVIPQLLGTEFDPSGSPAVSTLSVNITIPNQAGGALLAPVTFRAATTGVVVQSVTYTPSGGSPVSLAVIDRHDSGPLTGAVPSRVVELWGLVDPPFGTSGVLTVVLSAVANSVRLSGYFSPDTKAFGARTSANSTVDTVDQSLSLTTTEVNSQVFAAVRVSNGGARPFTPQSPALELEDGETSAVVGANDNDHGYTDLAKFQATVGAVTLATQSAQARPWNGVIAELKSVAPVVETGWVTVWNMPLSTFVNAANATLSGSTVARTTLGTAPDGTAAAEILARGGEPNDLAQYKPTLPPSPIVFNQTRMRCSVKGWLETGYAFNPTGSGKYPCGFSINVPGQSPSSGNHTHCIAHHKTGASNAGFNADHFSGTFYGPDMATTLPIGQWFTLRLTLELETVGQSNGSCLLELLNSAGVVIDSVQRTGVRWRLNSSATIVAPYLLEMWGGNFESASQWPPRFQKSWWKDWRFERPA